MKDLPLFPLRTVLFPGGRLNLRVFERRYLDMVSACLRHRSPFGVCLIKRGAEVGPAAEPEALGTLAEVVDCDVAQPGIVQINVRGGARFRVGGTETRQDQLLVSNVTVMPEPHVTVPARHRRLSEALRRLLTEAGPNSHFPPPQWNDAGWVGGRLAELLPLPVSLKQALLEMDEPAARLDALVEFLSRADRQPNP